MTARFTERASGSADARRECWCWKGPKAWSLLLPEVPLLSLRLGCQGSECVGGWRSQAAIRVLSDGRSSGHGP